MSLLPNPFKVPRAARRPEAAPLPALPLLPFRATLYTSRYYFSVTRRLWHTLMLSTPVDLLLLLLTPQILVNENLSILFLRSGALCAVAGGLIWFVRDLLIDLVFALQLTQRRLAVRSTWPAVALIAIVTLGGLAEFALRFSQVSTVTVVVGGLIAYGAVTSILKEVQKRKAEATALEMDRTARIEQANYSLFLIGVFPIAAARLSALLAGIGLILTHAPAWQSLLPPVGAAALLCVFFPHLEQFTFNCQRCGTTTSRALRAGGFCPMCLMATSTSQHLVVPSSENFAQSLLRRLEAKDSAEPSPHGIGSSRQDSPVAPGEKALADLTKLFEVIRRLLAR
jgi:hypothetical protein